jgi:hypothetical protein
MECMGLEVGMAAGNGDETKKGILRKAGAGLQKMFREGLG